MATVAVVSAAAMTGTACTAMTGIATASVAACHGIARSVSAITRPVAHTVIFAAAAVEVSAAATVETIAGIAIAIEIPAVSAAVVMFVLSAGDAS